MSCAQTVTAQALSHCHTVSAGLITLTDNEVHC
jgi:hypothetical protein